MQKQKKCTWLICTCKKIQNIEYLYIIIFIIINIVIIDGVALVLKIYMCIYI